MVGGQPLVEALRVEATWNGDPLSAVNLKVSFDIAACCRSHLSLIRNSHPSVLSAEVTGISKLQQNDDIVSPRSGSIHCFRPQQETFVHPKPYPNFFQQGHQQHDSPLLHGQGLTSIFTDRNTRPYADTTQSKHQIHSISDDQQDPSKETAELPLFSQTATSYETASSPDSALSPPLPSTAKKLTIPKRFNLGPRSNHTSNQDSPTRQILSRNDVIGTQTALKRPVLLDKRPPWRPVGADVTTPRGRKHLGTDVVGRRFSRSAGAVQVNGGRSRHRQSSLPGQMLKKQRGLHNMQTGECQSLLKTLPRGRPTRSPKRAGFHDRDTTVKVTRDAEAINASERLEKWLEDRRNDWPTEDRSLRDFVSDEDRSSRISGEANVAIPALSPSPTPSSRAALPWTSPRGIRGGGYIDGKEVPLATLVEDNGTTFVFFQGWSAGESKSARFRIEIHASVKLEAQPSGYHSLAIPGLPLQGGDAEGTFSLKIISLSSAANDGYKAYEKVAYVDDAFSTHPLQHDQMSHTFRLDMPFHVKLLCFEACRILQPSNFEIDSDVHTRYDWENFDDDTITAEHLMVCSIRLHPFLMWAEHVKLKLYLIGGPSGTLETCLEPGNRRIYLDGKSCDAEHELEVSMTCAVADLQKTFTISWEQSLGVAPFERWLPRISGIYRQKVEDIFDLPREADLLIAPRPCKSPRQSSMVARERFIKSSGNTFFLAENQHTPGTIRQSLGDQSSQFYEELTAEDPESTSATPMVENCLTPPKHAFITLKPNRRPRCQSNFWTNIVTDLDHRPTIRLGHNELAEKTSPIADAAKPKKIPPIEAAHDRSNYSLVRSVNFMLDMLRWLLGRFAAPARLLKTMIMIWLCFRAFDREIVVHLENSIVSTARNAWDSWDFEPVQLHGDFTGWKHLMTKINHGAASVIREGHLVFLSPPDAQSQELQNVMEDIPVETEVTEAEATSGADPHVLADEAFSDRSSSPSEAQQAGENRFTLLDRIDLALGWRPPAGRW